MLLSGGWKYQENKWKVLWEEWKTDRRRKQQTENCHLVEKLLSDSDNVSSTHMNWIWSRVEVTEKKMEVARDILICWYNWKDNS